MQRIFCHNCNHYFTVRTQGWQGQCPSCQEGFVEAVGQAEAPPADRSRQPGFHSSFQLPGGFGTVQLFVSSGGGGFHGGPMGPGPDPFELINALLRGPAVGGQDLLFGFGPDYDQEQMDRVITQIMNQYQPASRSTAQRVRDSLPRLKVRARRACQDGGQEGLAPGAGAAGDDAEMGMATVCEGDQCPVCQDEFKAGGETVELPCNHCFHEDCIMPWLDTHNTCPVCRLELPVEGASGTTSRASSRRGQQQEQGGAPAEGGWVGSFNQLLHSIADRWEASHSGQGQETGGSGTAAQAPASRQPSGRAGAAERGEPRPPESPRTAAGRAAAARAGAAAGQGARDSSRGLNSGGGSRSWPGPVPGAGAASHRQQEQQQQPTEGGSSQQGMALGGVLAGLVGSAVSALLGRNSRPQQE